MADYQDFEPRFEWLHHPDSRVLIVHLLGFRSKQLKVQVTSSGKVRIYGERRLGSGKWLRFHKEIDVPSDADTENISARLEEGILYVKLPLKHSAGAPSTNPPDQKPKPSAQSQSQPPPAAAAKPKVNPQPPAEPQKPAAAKPTVVDPLWHNEPKSQIERPQSQAKGKQIPTPPKPHEAPKPKEAAEAAVDQMKLPAADPPTVRQNAPRTQNDKPQTQAGGKHIPTPQMLQDRTEEEKEEEKARTHTKLKEALEKTRDDEEEVGKEKEEEKEGEVAEERRKRRRRKRSEEMVEESGRVRREGGGGGRGRYQQVIDGVVKELRTNMVTLVLGVAVFVIVYFNVTKKGHVEEEL